MKPLTLFLLAVVILSLTAFSQFSIEAETVLIVATPTASPTPDAWQATLAVNQTQNASYAATQGAKLTLTALAPTATPTQTATRPVPTSTPIPTSTLAALTAVAFNDPSAYQNASLSPQGEKITAQTLEKLTLAAQWGRGSIIRVAYADDYFVVGSRYGLAVYEVGDMASSHWIAFNQPLSYDTLVFSLDGQAVLVGPDLPFTLPEGQLARVEDYEWQTATPSGQDLHITSPDGKYIYVGTYEYGCPPNEEDCFAEEYTYEVMGYIDAMQPLYERINPARPIVFAERSQPEACDLYTFGYCGNAYMDIANTPYRAAFAPDGQTFAVLYRPRGLFYSIHFSVLRVYRTSDGKLLNAIGSYDHPVEDFAYAPNSHLLLAGMVGGSLQLWNLEENQIVNTLWPFDAPIEYMDYSTDGQYLLIKRTNQLEIRTTQEGAIRARFNAVAFALSPVENHLALAGYDGTIRILDLDTWQTLFDIPAHTDTIFSLTFSSDGRLLASSGQDCQIKLWDMETGAFIHYNEQTIVDAYGEGFTSSRIFIRHMEFVPGTNQLIGFGSWGTVVSWNVDSGASNYIAESAPSEYYNGMITLNPHFPEYFGVDYENDLFYINELGYHLTDGTVASPYQAPAGLPQGCLAAGPVTADGTLRFTLGYDAREGQVCVLDTHTLELVRVYTFLPSSKTRQDDTLGWLYLSPDGSQLAVSTRSGVVFVLEVGE